MFSMRRWLWILLTVFATGAYANDYPTRTIKLVVPFAAGGFTDVLGRAVAQHLSAGLGQPVIVENRTGAGGAIGAELVARSAPDGYTLLLGNNPLVVNASLRKDLPYSPLKDFTPVTLLGSTPNVLVVHDDFPAKTLAEFVAVAKANPAKYSYATSSIGATTHFGMEMFKAAAGIDVVLVPYKGSAQLISDLLAGRISTTIDNLLFQLPYIQDKRVRPLALMGEKRSALLPDLPTVGELGYPGTEASPWYMVMAPAGTPRSIVERLDTEIQKVLTNPAFLKQVEGMQVTPGTTAAQAQAYFEAEFAKWDKVVKSLGMAN